MTFMKEEKLPSEGTKLNSDFVAVRCKSSKNATYENLFMTTMRNSNLKHRTPVGKPPPLNVLIFGFDSTSRLAWQRNLPKSHRYFTEMLGK